MNQFEIDAIKALRVILLTPHTLQYLEAMDPQAAIQALRAIPYSQWTPEDKSLLERLEHHEPRGPLLLRAAHNVLRELDKLPVFLEVCVCGHRNYLHTPNCGNGYRDSQKPTAVNHPCLCPQFRKAGTWYSVAALYGGSGAYFIDTLADQGEE